MENWGWLLVVLVVFLICRELVCWYWKQNQQVELLKDIRHTLEQLLDVMDPEHKKKEGSIKNCKQCGAENTPSNTHCLGCGKPF